MNHIKKDHDCNCCQPNVKCKGKRVASCSAFRSPKGGWILAELALAHPQGLHEALVALPFETNLSFHLPKA